MKKIICIVVTLFSLNALNAQTTTPQTKEWNTNHQKPNSSVNVAQPGTQINVPDNIRTRYNTDYPKTQPMWTKDGSKYRAEYRDQSSQSSQAIVYDEHGNQMFTERQVNTGTYPDGINNHYSRTYPNEAYHVWSSQDDTGNPYFYINRDSETIYFDENGNYLRSNRRTDQRP